MSRQVDQAFCDICGDIHLTSDRHGYAKTLAKARAHAKNEGHNVHVLISDSLHYRYADPSPSDGGDDA